MAITRFGTDYFNEMATKHFGKSYDQLTDAERALLHGAAEEAEGFASKAWRASGAGLGVLCAGWAIHDAYKEGSKLGKGLGYSYAVGRAFIELLQYGYPPASAAELVVRLTAGVISLGVSAYKNDVLETLYRRYAAGERLDDLLDTTAVAGYFAGGLRQMVIEMRQENPRLTEEQIAQKIRDYFVRRREAEKIASEQERQIAFLEAWMASRGISLVSADSVLAQSDNDRLKRDDPEEYYRRIAALMENYQKLAEMLAADGVPATREQILHFLFLLYRGPQGAFDKALADLYREFGKTPRGKLTRAGGRPRLVTARRTTLTRGAVKPEETLRAGQQLAFVAGFWKYKLDAGDPPKTFGPFDVPCGGKLRAEIEGNPPAPAKWSLGNWNTGMVVVYIPRYGKKLGPGTEILRLAGQTKDNKLSGEATWPGPGQIVVHCTPARGSGPLTSSQFDQSYTGKVTVVEAYPHAPALAGTELRDGDRLQTDPGGNFLLASGAARLLGERNADLTLRLRGDSEPSGAEIRAGQVRVVEPPGTHTFDLTLRLKGPVDPQTKQEKPGPILTLRPRGTSYEVEHLGERARIRVLDGAIAIGDAGAQEVELAAGQAIELPGGKPTSFDPKADKGGLADGLPVAEIPADDDVPQPHGTFGGQLADGKLTDGWLWQDPRNDATLEATEPGTLRIVVPDGNDFWDNRLNAPRLLHKATGDFDLEVECRLECKGPDNAIFDFLLYAPGSYQGFLDKQFQQDGIGAHYRKLGGWAKMQGVNKLAALNRRLHECPDAPDRPVRFRMTRRDDTWKGYWSLDGQRWTLFTREQFDLPDTLWVGVCPTREAWDRQHGEKATFTLRDLRLTTAQRGSMAVADWDFVQAEGTAEASGTSIRLALDPAKTGSIHAITGRKVEGDMDIAVSFATAGFTDKPGHTCTVQLYAADGQEKNLLYISRHRSDRNGNRLSTDIRVNERWGHGYQWLEWKATQGNLRIARKGETWTTFYADKGQWVRLDKKFAAGFADPVYVGVVIDTRWEAKQPSPLVANIVFSRLPAPAAKAPDTPGTTATTVPAHPPATERVPGQQTLGDLTLTIPQRWQRAASSAQDEGVWFLGPRELPVVSFGVLRRKSFDTLVSELQVIEQRPIEVDKRAARSILGTLAGGRGTVWLVLFEKPGADGRLLGLCAQSLTANWAEHVGALRAILQSVRFAQAP
ncbi:MAG: hypothetical protein FJ290_24260 [Planctomycetes bacterium]|nr:hypothetical protein [Planctomycetota bacterium]